MRILSGPSRRYALKGGAIGPRGRGEDGCAPIFAGYTVTVGQARASGIAGTLGLMWRIGREVQQARAARRNVIETLTVLLHSVVLFRGKANRVNQRSEGGFNHGTACFVGVDNDSGGRFDVLFQNEYLLARRDDRPLCMTPDLIILLDEETGLPSLGERLCYGMRVVALGVPANEKWRMSRGIEVCGPRYFHYQNDYTSVERRWQPGTRRKAHEYIFGD